MLLLTRQSKPLRMKNSDKEQILENAKAFFRENIVYSHINNGCKKAAKLKEYNVNPFLYKYLANFLSGSDDAYSIAKALVLPRVLGSSINTSFGMHMQKLVSTLFQGMGSTTQGIDLEYIDAVDGRKKYCQLKAGPNTINFDDVTTINNHFSGVRNLARTNNLNIGLNDLVVGVLYGEKIQLSSHYKSIEKDYPVLVGEEFWYRLTGDENFYTELIDAIGDVAIEVNGKEVLEETIQALAEEIKTKYKVE